MVDKINGVPRGRVGGTIGRLDAVSMAEVDRVLSLLLGLV
jgi:hypothetical protein